MTQLAAPIRRFRPVPESCPPKPALAKRRLLSPSQAADLAATFKVLANDTRLRLLHALCRAGELCVMELAEAVGMKPQAVSNQLQRLADKGIVESRRQGNSIYYRVIDPCVVGLLDLGLCLAEDSRRRRR
ncbi:ArsR/SmtB family transcription factor [Fontivita pretiosa]|uniref:ArsR/SmtB family transcription factor n=1 Tax=Fontivita pretiosa TaxID=2989684 RepID=UPI003D1696E7